MNTEQLKILMQIGAIRDFRGGASSSAGSLEPVFSLFKEIFLSFLTEAFQAGKNFHMEKTKTASLTSSGTFASFPAKHERGWRTDRL